MRWNELNVSASRAYINVCILTIYLWNLNLLFNDSSSILFFEAIYFFLNKKFKSCSGVLRVNSFVLIGWYYDWTFRHTHDNNLNCQISIREEIKVYSLKVNFWFWCFQYLEFSLQYFVLLAIALFSSSLYITNIIHSHSEK